jgi:hypothetical protein
LFPFQKSVMKRLSFNRIHSYRAGTFRTLPGRRISSQEQAIDYVNERGFIYFWPIKDIVLPSLWVAAAGDRPVADAHDDPGHVTWGWKDSLLGARCWYYAKILRKRATMISLEVAPYFYALSKNYGEPEEDYLALYQQGKMTQESKLIYEALLNKGVLDTIALRRATHLTSRESESRFNRAMTELQADFKVLPVAVTQSGAWRYAFAYDLVHRHYPELPEQARFVQENRARQELARLYFRSVGAAQVADLVKLFGWTAAEAERAIQALVQSRELRRGLELENQPGEWIALAGLAEA